MTAGARDTKKDSEGPKPKGPALGRATEPSKGLREQLDQERLEAL